LTIIYFYYIFREYYFTAVSWVESNTVSVIWMNRAQNISLVTHCAPPSWICKEVSTDIYKINRESYRYLRPQAENWQCIVTFVLPSSGIVLGNLLHIIWIMPSKTIRPLDGRTNATKTNKFFDLTPSLLLRHL
jgi:hypothetical protein